MHVVKCSKQFSVFGVVLRCSGWLLGCCCQLSRFKLFNLKELLQSFNNILGGCQGVAMQLLSVQMHFRVLI